MASHESTRTPVASVKPTRRMTGVWSALLTVGAFGAAVAARALAQASTDGAAAPPSGDEPPGDDALFPSPVPQPTYAGTFELPEWLFGDVPEDETPQQSHRRDASEKLKMQALQQMHNDVMRQFNRPWS